MSKPGFQHLILLYTKSYCGLEYRIDILRLYDSLVAKFSVDDINLSFNEFFKSWEPTSFALESI